MDLRPPDFRPAPRAGTRRWHLALTAMLTLGTGLAANAGSFPGGEPVRLGLTSEFAGWPGWLLFEVRALDAPAFMGATFLLSTVSLVVTWLSTRRSSRVLSSEAVRSE